MFQPHTLRLRDSISASTAFGQSSEMRLTVIPSGVDQEWIKQSTGRLYTSGLEALSPALH